MSKKCRKCQTHFGVDRLSMRAECSESRLNSGISLFMAIVAQLVRALVCGTRGRRFESGLSPHFFYLDKFEVSGSVF